MMRRNRIKLEMNILNIMSNTWCYFELFLYYYVLLFLFDILYVRLWVWGMGWVDGWGWVDINYIVNIILDAA